MTLAALGAAPLSDDAAFGGPKHAAVVAVRRELARLLDAPSAYFALAEDGGDLVVVEIWPSRWAHDDACVEAARRDEKSRLITYDVTARRIVATRWVSDTATEK